jgi:hypothetical protein
MWKGLERKLEHKNRKVASEKLREAARRDAIGTIGGRRQETEMELRIE